MIANAFLAYFIGGDILIQHILDGPFKHLNTLINLLVFTTVFFFVFAWFREQACIIVCPYGRLQGVLLDNHSINVAYDFKRGEGRQKLRKNEDRDANDGEFLLLEDLQQNSGIYKKDLATLNAHGEKGDLADNS